MNKQISEKTLRQLEWPQLVVKLKSFAQTDEGQERCTYLQPDRHASYISQRWDDVVPLRDIVRSGYTAPVGALPKLHSIFKGVDKGSILEGLELRLVWDLLSSTRKVIAFVSGFSNKSKYLQRLKGQLYGLPTVFSAIEKAISLDGSLLDTA